jgi:hypothetical protein
MHPLYPIDAVNEISIVLARKSGQEDGRSRDAGPRDTGPAQETKAARADP